MTDTEATTPAELTAAIVGALHNEHFPTGDRAALKRMAPEGRAPLAYHRFIMSKVPERWQGGRYESSWRTLIAAIALQPAHPHDANRPVGEALARIDFSEDRLERLLAADDSVLNTLVLRAARRLAAHHARANWNDLARLLFAYGDEARERINQRIARGYYRVPNRDSENG